MTTFLRPGAGLASVWTLLALALTLLPLGTGGTPRSGRGDGRARAAHAREIDRRRRPRTALARVFAGGAVGLMCVVVLGPGPGGVAAVVVVPAVMFGVRELQRRTPPVPVDRSVALALDLAAAALRSGRPVHQALELAAPSAATAVRDRLLRVAGLVRLGADAEQAWAELAAEPALAPVAQAAIRSATSGIRLATAFERLAGEIRADAATAATVRAERAGVFALGPLGACFLPSFVCLGVVPVVVGIARTAFGALA